MSLPASITDPGAGSPSTQVRACRICAISKARCIPRPNSENGKCERCNRLSKECLPGMPVPKRPRRSRISRTARLEERLDGLVSLLAGSQKLTPSPAMIYDPGDRNQSTDPTQFPAVPPGKLDDTGWTPDAARSNSESKLSHPQIPSSHIHGDILDHPSWVLFAGDRLQVFKDKLTSQFPFVVLNPSTTAEELRRTKPFLYQNIILVASYSSVSLQSRLKSEVMKCLAEQIFLQGKKSLELLQGILVLAAWYHQFLWDSPQLTNLIQIATALVFDLGLHKTENSLDGREIFGRGRTKSPRTLEERRAFLGLYCLSRGLSVNIGKIEPLQNTPYVEDCCLEIERQQEYLTDRYLTFQIRSQNLTESISHSFPLHGADYLGILGPEPVSMLVKSFEEDLERFKKTLEPELAEKELFQVHLASVSIHNSEIALRRGTEPGINVSRSNAARLSLLMTCLQSTKAFFAAWLSLPASLYHHLPMNVFALVAHASIILGMLNSFQHDGWDLDIVRATAPFSQTTDCLAQKYEEASRETDNGENTGCSAFKKEGMKMKSLIGWYNARLRSLMNEEQSFIDTEVLAGLGFDMFDDQFWAEDIAWVIHSES